MIEDQADNRRIVRDLLTRAGYELIEAATGEEGVALASSHRPDVILMDIRLPGLDGFEATRRIKSNADLARIPIIAVTAYSLGDDHRTASDASVDAYITKPFSPRELLSTIRQYLEDGGGP